MKFPTLVYCSPGPHPYRGNTYGYKQVNDLGELKQAALDGFYPTRDHAIRKPADFNWGDYAQAAGWVEADVEETDEPFEEENPQTEAPATRQELEAKATELNIGFNSRTADATLMQKIEAALATQTETVDGA